MEAQGNAGEGGIGIKGQPGGAALGNARLGDEQVRAAREKQADHPPGPGAALRQGFAEELAGGLQFAVGNDPWAPDQGGVLRHAGRGGGEDLGERFFPQQIRAIRAAQDGGTRAICVRGVGTVWPGGWLGGDWLIHRSTEWLAYCQTQTEGKCFGKLGTGGADGE